MQEWEIKRLFIPTTLRVDKGDLVGVYKEDFFTPVWGDESNEKWSKAEALAANGWEPVGIVQIVTGHEFTWGNPGGGSSHTAGFMFIFKRPLPPVE